MPPVSPMNEAWQESVCTGGKDSSFLDDVETKCPCKFLSPTHCSLRGKSKQACQTQLAGHYRCTMVPCVWGPTQMFPRFLAHLCTDRAFPFKAASFFEAPFPSYHFLLLLFEPLCRFLSPQSHLHGLLLSLPLTCLMSPDSVLLTICLQWLEVFRQRVQYSWWE